MRISDWSSDVCSSDLATEVPMYNQSRQSGLIRFARVDAGSTVIDVYPGDGDWNRIFSDAAGPEGRHSSFVPAEVAHKTGQASCRQSVCTTVSIAGVAVTLQEQKIIKTSSGIKI